MNGFGFLRIWAFQSSGSTILNELVFGVLGTGLSLLRLSVFVTACCPRSHGLWLSFLELTAQKGKQVNHLSGLYFSRGIYNIA